MRVTGNNYSGPRWAFSERPARPKPPRCTCSHAKRSHEHGYRACRAKECSCVLYWPALEQEGATL